MGITSGTTHPNHQVPIKDVIGIREATEFHAVLASKRDTNRANL